MDRPWLRSASAGSRLINLRTVRSHNFDIFEAHVLTEEFFLKNSSTELQSFSAPSFKPHMTMLYLLNPFLRSSIFVLRRLFLCCLPIRRESFESR